MTFNRLTLAFSLGLLALPIGIQGQTITGAITGSVTDPSGSIIPNAKVTATNKGTNISSETQTNESGFYNLPFLPIGDYTLSISVSGFKKSTLGPFKLEVNQIARVDVKMEVGDTTQTVEVKDVAPILQTESTATGDSLSASKLTALPLNGRNFASLTLLIPGAISTSPNAMNTSGRFQGSGSRPQVNGNREQTNNFLLDGIDVNDSIDNRIGYQPSVDALEEVKVITGNGGAEFGNVGGAIVNMSIKSGTNQYHGNVFEFLRNDKLDSNGFFRNKNLTPRAPFRRNIFGGTFGGPIKKDKAFFFMDYEGTEQRSSGASTASVAKAAWRTGDLSDWLKLSTPQLVRDPNTGAILTDRTPFPNNQIPASRITNPVAKKLFSDPLYYPLPNQAGSGTLGITSNYLASTASLTKNHQADVKLDYRLSDKDNISGRWSIGRYESYTSLNPLIEQMGGGTTGPTQTAVINWNRTFTTTIVNEFRVGFSRIGIDDNVVDWSGKLTKGNADFGIGGGQPIPGLSSISLGDGLTGIGSIASIGSTMDNKYQYFDNLTWVKGRHLIKMGGSAVRYQQNRYYAGNNGALGSFTYGNVYSGVNYGDFLLNALSAKGRGSVTGKWGHRSWRSSIFFQDDYKLRSDFTLNLGIRWEYAQPIYEVADRQVNIDTYTGKLLYAGKDGNSRALYRPYYKQFQPRLGFAWTPGMLHNKMVMRAGYAFTSFMEGTGANLRLPLNPPFFLESNVTYDTRTPSDIAIGFTDVAATGVLSGPRTGSAPFYQGRAWDQDLKPQFTQQYNFSLEYQVSNTWSLTGAYVGQKGSHLVVPHEANQALAGTGAFASWANINDRRPLVGVLPNVGNIALTEGSARSSYNALQMSTRKRLSQGFEFLGSYTYSKTMMDNLGYYGCGSVNSDGAYWQNAYDRLANRGPACFDARNNFTLGGLYNLPVGKGQKWGSSLNKVADLIVGGWNLNYFFSAHSGFPVTITARDNTGQAARGNVRAMRYRNFVVQGTRSVDTFFGTGIVFCGDGINDGTCAYGQGANGQFGSAGVGTERAPSFFNMDASIGKKFNVTERQYFDFRMEMFNALNHVSWGPPARAINTPATFGQITGQIQNPRNIQFGLKYYF
ncbi:carboxypeptidase regulatory-like domain-containing protein [Paludibaculum fermentans]|uniref:carboxypeptidase regulatory-like domain-containing protein n=1 Tax=Paludibaculum fermentans TaxID=1473598 RepID=UPI003EB81A25